MHKLVNADDKIHCKVGFKKPGDIEPRDFIDVDPQDTIKMTAKAIQANFIEYEVIEDEGCTSPKKAKQNAFDVLMSASCTKVLPPEDKGQTQLAVLHNRLLAVVKNICPRAGFSPDEITSLGKH